MASPLADEFSPGQVVTVRAENIIDTYQCMSDSIRTVIVAKTIVLEDSDGSETRQFESGFFAFDNLLFFLSDRSLDDSELTIIESTFICMSSPLPSKLFKDSFPQSGFESTSVPVTAKVWSSPSMLSNWSRGDTLPIRGDEKPSDCHTDVSQATSRISKYMRIAKPLSSHSESDPVESSKPVEPIRVDLSRKRPRDAREFREQIIANGAQAEFYIWSLIKAKYGDAADLSWWLTSTKRTFFPVDRSPIDDSIGSDFFIPKDDQCLFATKRGGPVHVEVKGTGRFCGFNQDVTFEISRNELQMAQEAIKKGEEYVVAVVSGLAGINRPKLETVVRDLSQLDLTPTRFIATVPKPPAAAKSELTGPPHTKSSWY